MQHVGYSRGEEGRAWRRVNAKHVCASLDWLDSLLDSLARQISSAYTGEHVDRLFAVSLHTNFSADSSHVKLCPSHSSIALYAIVSTMTLLLPDGPPLSQIVDLTASILSLRFSIPEIQNLCEMRSCLNAHESQYLSPVFLSRQPVANISLQWTFSRTKLIWLALFGKGHRLSAKGYGVTLKAAVSSLHPSTFLARK